MYEYGQYCPVARASEILADRWTPLIIRELLAGIRHFNGLDRGLPGVSRSLLSERLQRLERTGIVTRHRSPDGHHTEYRLTRAGLALQQVIDVVGTWGARWAFGDPRPRELDPVVLLWWMRRRVHQDRLPSQRMVVEFQFRGAHAGSYWLVLTPRDVSVCLQHPRFDIDLRVHADLATFYMVWLGRRTLAGAAREGRIRLDGPPSLVTAFPTWFAWSPMAEAVRAATHGVRSRGRGEPRAPGPPVGRGFAPGRRRPGIA
jgi:DNA-binding HxlR family transcriptional regulator